MGGGQSGTLKRDLHISFEQNWNMLIEERYLALAPITYQFEFSGMLIWVDTFLDDKILKLQTANKRSGHWLRRSITIRLGCVKRKVIKSHCVYAQTIIAKQVFIYMVVIYIVNESFSTLIMNGFLLLLSSDYHSSSKNETFDFHFSKSAARNHLHPVIQMKSKSAHKQAISLHFFRATIDLSHDALWIKK